MGKGKEQQDKKINKQITNSARRVIRKLPLRISSLIIRRILEKTH